jgi:hypothetical protein
MSPRNLLLCILYSDTKSKTELFKTIGTVKNAIADTQEEKRNIAYVHMKHGEYDTDKHFFLLQLLKCFYFFRICKRGLPRAGSVALSKHVSHYGPYEPETITDLSQVIELFLSPGGV